MLVLELLSLVGNTVPVEEVGSSVVPDVEVGPKPVGVVDVVGKGMKAADEVTSIPDGVIGCTKKMLLSSICRLEVPVVCTDEAIGV